MVGLRHRRPAQYADDHGGYLAAIVTYYAFFSLSPLMLVATTVLGFVLRGHARLQSRPICARAKYRDRMSI
jgi:uncharacterized BrkB/YihY/UPF0761 family membrane protein